MFWYHTPSCLHSIFPDTLNVCWRCGLTGGILFHLFWDCSGIIPFWLTVQNWIHRELGVKIPLTLLEFLLTVPPCKLHRTSSRLLLHRLLTVAKCLKAKYWKQSLIPTLLDLSSHIKEVRSMERLSPMMSNRINFFESIWFLWYSLVLDQSLSYGSCHAGGFPPDITESLDNTIVPLPFMFSCLVCLCVFFSCILRFDYPMSFILVFSYRLCSGLE